MPVAKVSMSPAWIFVLSLFVLVTNLKGRSAADQPA
jgi:hypothetical protein